MLRSLGRVLAIALLALPLIARGQSREGELRVHVSDPSQLGVSASVRLLDHATQLIANAKTDDAGDLAIAHLPFGTYRLRIDAAGFATEERDISIVSQVPLRIDVAVRVQPRSESLTVTEHPKLVDPDESGAGSRIGANTIENSPASLPGHAVSDLVNSQPGWLLEANGVLHPRGSEYQVQFVVDGLPYTDNRSPAFAPSLDSDDVQEMTVLTGDYPAEYGRKLGGIVEVETKSDLRDGFHGEIVSEGGSFGSFDQSLLAQFRWGRNALSLSGDAAITDRYLDPPVAQNFTNHGKLGNASMRFERDLTSRDRIDISLRHSDSEFDVPNELVQQIAGQRQMRGIDESAATFAYQHVFSTDALASFSGMLRDLSATLDSDPLSTPILATQHRGVRDGYMRGAIAIHRKAQEIKFGADADFANLSEAFAYQVTDPTQFDPATPAAFSFFGRGRDREQSAFAQDLIRVGDWTISAGARYDHYHLLVDESAVSPRLGVARYVRSADLVLHASYDRAFQTPAFENLLLSSSLAVGGLSDNVLRLVVKPSHGDFYEVGATKGFSSRLRIDANYYRRDVNNYADDDVLFETGVSFPIAFSHSTIYGAETKISVPKWGRFSGFADYSYMVGFAYLPVTGGLFLGDDAAGVLSANTKFPVSQDQRNTSRALVRYEISPRVWTAFSAQYGSGLPTEFHGTSANVLAEYGPAVLSQINLQRDRVRPNHSLDGSVGAMLWKSEAKTVTLQADIENFTNQFRVIDFAGLFSGTAIAPPRSYDARVRFSW